MLRRLNLTVWRTENDYSGFHEYPKAEAPEAITLQVLLLLDEFLFSVTPVDNSGYIPLSGISGAGRGHFVSGLFLRGKVALLAQLFGDAFGNTAHDKLHTLRQLVQIKTTL